MGERQFGVTADGQPLHTGTVRTTTPNRRQDGRGARHPGTAGTSLVSQASSPPANTSSSSPSLLNNRCPSSITHSSSGFNPPRAEPSSTATTALPQSINARSQSRRRSRRAWFRRSNRRRASAHPSARSNMSSPPHDRSTYDATSVFSMPVPEPYSSSSTCTARSQGNDTHRSRCERVNP